MIKATAAFAVLMFACFCTTARCQSLAEINGSDWNSWPQAARASFIIGAQYGVVSAHAAMNDALAQMLAGVATRDKKDPITTDIKVGVINLGFAYVNSIQMSGVSPADLERGLTTFYADTKNLKVQVFDAMLYAHRQLKGIPGEDLERIVRYLRQGKTPEAMNNLIVKDKRGQLVRVVDFP